MMSRSGPRWKTPVLRWWGPAGKSWRTCWYPSRKHGPGSCSAPDSRSTESDMPDGEPRQELVRLASGSRDNSIDFTAAQPGQRPGDAANVSRLIARSRPAGFAEPGRRNVRRVGFQHNGFERQALREPPDLQGAIIGHRASEPQLEALVDVLLRLLKTPVEGVGNAQHIRLSAQVLQHFILGAAHVHNDRQVEPPRQLQLG